ncbi:hypothetical protein Nepgr_032455 [Nepenthes gracilis]|uniref:ATP-dependent Clp protease proteolytic subunit n=1 Tax=Nepenthes gracilis TaxID=150966 RepID=A0AAD3Y5S2_NEPGR|nr:hypothetical protein Nepgr_032455 [Nepenthes gracilis]
MEISSLTSMGSSSRPLSFFNHHLKPFRTKPSSISTTKDRNCTSCGRRAMPVKDFKVPATLRTLSSNWDVSGSVAPLLPRLEELDTTNMLLRQRIVFIGSQIDDMTADFIISQLLFLDAEDPKKDIKLFINSPGGSVTAGMGIYDAMKLCKADVSTVCLGLAASMGAFILASGTKGKRFCMPNSRVMIHQPLGTAGGKATEMSIRIREMSYHKVKINKIMSRITGRPEQQIEKDTDLADSAPPPKTKVWDLWKVEGSRKAKKNLPSEHKILQNWYDESRRSDENRHSEPEKEAPTAAV